jgi:hypothetical protein
VSDDATVPPGEAEGLGWSFCSHRRGAIVSAAHRALRLHFSLFRHLKGIIDVDAEVSHGALELRMSKGQACFPIPPQDLDASGNEMAIRATKSWEAHTDPKEPLGEDRSQPVPSSGLAPI